jgi:hypothetical protein
VGQYAYCAHAWWLAEVEKQAPVDLAPLEEGVGAHERHGWAVMLSRSFYRLALVLLGLGAVVLIVAATVAFVR